jgi:hypothetical protein
MSYDTVFETMLSGIKVEVGAECERGGEEVDIEQVFLLAVWTPKTEKAPAGFCELDTPVLLPFDANHAIYDKALAIVKESNALRPHFYQPDYAGRY